MDYKELVDSLDEEKIKKLLDGLGIPYQDKGSHLLCKTACHNEDVEEASWKLYYYKNNKFFFCYSECQGMSIFKFLKNYYTTRGIEYDWYQDIYEVVRDCANLKNFNGFVVEKYKSLKDRYGARRQEVQLPEYSSNVLDCFVKYYPEEWLSDGISKEAMDKFNISYSISQNKIIIPHYDINGRLVGIRGRALSEWEVENIGKYTPLHIEQNWYKHPLSMNLYGLNVTKDNIAKRGMCFVTEGEKSVLQAESFSFPNCTVATCGSAGINKYQLNMLLKIPNLQEIVLCYDKEEKPGEDKYFNKLWELCQKYKNYCNFSFIYDRSGLLNMKESPMDKGEETFMKLLEKRVRVK